MDRENVLTGFSIAVRNDGGSDHDGNSKVAKGFQNIGKVHSAGLPSGKDMKWERAKDNPNVFGLSNCKNDVVARL